MTRKHRRTKINTSIAKDQSVDESKYIPMIENKIDGSELYAYHAESDELLTVKDELKQRIFDRLNELIVEELTTNQKDVLEHIFYKGMTYKESADMFDRNYTTTVHSLYGIWQKGTQRYSGGSINMLRKILLKDTEYLTLSKCMKALSEDSDFESLSDIEDMSTAEIATALKVDA